VKGESGGQVPLLAGRVARDGKATVYLCQGRECLLPTTDPRRFAEQLTAASTRKNKAQSD